MSKIYVGQTALRMNFSCSSDITGYTTTVIDVQKPGGSTATWTATVSTASTGSMYYDIPTTSVLDVVGKYRMQPQVTFSDGTTAKAETAEIIVYESFG